MRGGYKEIQKRKKEPGKMRGVENKRKRDLCVEEISNKEREGDREGSWRGEERDETRERKKEGLRMKKESKNIAATLGFMIDRLSCQLSRPINLTSRFAKYSFPLVCSVFNLLLVINIKQHNGVMSSSIL